MVTQQNDTNVAKNTTDTPLPERARSPSYYNIVEESKRLGETATKTLVGVKDFLHQEVVLPTPDRLMSNITLLKQRMRHSSETIANVQTVFPLTLFPHSVVFDRSKITITKRTSPWSSVNVSIRIEDVLNVSTTLGMLFGSISIASRVMNSVDHFEIGGFWRRDAMELQRLIQGYAIAKHGGMDTDDLTVAELTEMLRELAGSA
jgi:hypothetical protein